jgi:hypothetical protein
MATDFPFIPNVYRSFVPLKPNEEPQMEEPVFRGLVKPLESSAGASSFWDHFEPSSNEPVSKASAHKEIDRAWAALEPIGVSRQDRQEESEKVLVEWLQTDGPFSSALSLEAAAWTEPFSSFRCMPSVAPHAVLNRVCTSLAAANIPFSAHPDRASVEGKQEVGARCCGFVLQAFQEGTSGGSHVVFELQRRHGCVLLFADLFQRVLGWLGAVVLEEQFLFAPLAVSDSMTPPPLPDNLGDIPPPLTLGALQPLELTYSDTAALLTMLDCPSQDVQLEALCVLATSEHEQGTLSQMAPWMDKLSCLSQQSDPELNRWAGLLITSVQGQIQS